MFSFQLVLYLTKKFLVCGQVACSNCLLQLVFCLFILCHSCYNIPSQLIRSIVYSCTASMSIKDTEKRLHQEESQDSEYTSPIKKTSDNVTLLLNKTQILIIQILERIRETRLVILCQQMHLKSEVEKGPRRTTFWRIIWLEFSLKTWVLIHKMNDQMHKKTNYKIQKSCLPQMYKAMIPPIVISTKDVSIP